MGLMTTPAANGQLVLTPHPVTLEGQRHIAMDLQAGERLCEFLHRHVFDLDQSDWTVSIGGRVVPRHLWAYVYPKDGQVIEVRGAVGRNALYIVAMAALIYFTGGAGATWAAGLGTTGAAVVYTAAFVVGAIVINKVLGPKVESPAAASNAGTVYSLGAARNRPRPYEPLGLLFGRMRIAPDVASTTYSFYEGDDQYLGMVLTPGIGVGRVGAFSNGDTLLSSYEGVSIYHAGYSQMPDEAIPLYSNVDTIDGGELPDTADFVTRTSSADTVRIQINLEYVLGGVGTSGKAYNVSETVQVQYAQAGSGIWATLATQTFTGDKLDVSKRATLSADVPKGQYDVRVRILGLGNYDGDNTQRNDFQWSTMGSVQADGATYDGISRTGILLKATGQLNGQPDQLRAEHIAAPIPVWRNGSWVTEETSNNGAHILKYARGYFNKKGQLIAGMGKSDEEIDIESLQGFMAHCEANGYTYDYWLTEERSHDEVLQAIALAGMGQVTWAGGRLSVVWAADEQPLSGVVNMAEMKKGSFSVDYTLASAADGIEYSYFDSTTNKVETLRVPAPGVETMLNPARLTGEGIGREAHAAEMARYHLGQSLYQYKDIGFAQDLQYLAYRRMSMLSISHDLTQWGFGGRVVAAERSPLLGTVTLTLDEPVPPPDARSAFIGLRIPGEAVYRTFRVRSFTEATDTIQLVEEWPDDAPLPGEGYADSMVQGGWQDNPAHDTVWIYDFKATPGLRVRVVAIEPESDLKGASISVVPESPEFWTYVKTGQYIPPDSGSSLATRPVMSNLRIDEDQITTGDVTATDLVATFDISGPFDHAVVYASASDGNGELQEVAQTRTRTARWRIPRAGTYTINVRPFGPDGQLGIGASLIYTTIGADAPPVNYDIFDVEEISGGIRRYTWGFWTDTIQSANLAGAEIRYIEAPEQGAPVPAWDAMTPVGDSGYHTGAFDSPIPSSGKWTFAIRARNTNGTLSVTAKYLTKTLGKNLGELQEEMQQAIDQTTEEIRQGFLEAVARDQELAQQLLEQAQDLANLQALVEAPEWVDQAWPAGSIVKHDGGLYVAKQDVPVGTAITDTAFWSYIGQYASLAEAVGAIGVAMQQVTTEVQQFGQELEVIAQDVSGVRSSLAGKADSTVVQAMNTRLTQAENSVTSLSQLIGSVQSALAGKADASALQAIQSQVSQQGNEITAQSTAISSVTSKLGGRPNILTNGGFESGIWTNGSASGFVVSDGAWGRIMTHASPSGIGSGGQAVASNRFSINAGETVTVSWDSVLYAQAGRVSMDIEWFRADGTYISSSTRSPVIQATHNFMDGDARRQERAFTRTPPTGCTQAQVRLIWENVVGCTALGFRRIKVEYGVGPATPYSADATVVGQASVTQSLTTRVTRTENGVASYEAAATLALDVNGRVAGTRSVNNGTTATIDFAFDKVRFIGVDAGQGRSEIINGKIYCYAPNGVQVVAIGAGV
ncbi:host specificity factor TipJ family phage tail protein [Xanthomonas campestris pv. plantaginis]|uniref:host specificity factor TipJ family phage tail protein n=1 Tax=Xanthomonas campestris TaxID=339 RepID=UPI002B22EFFD|nr:host specificity factor TipJ family phage tail protein [Xanthomonas campestris]MEA9605697.1 host specificity factor TipJ family phage tail protein [Xanthomonas campestris pv. plantaginis]